MVEALVSVGADPVSIVVAAFCVMLRCLELWTKGRDITSEQCASALLNGASVFPFILMFCAAFSPKLLEIAGAAQLSLALAGGVGLVFVLGEVLKPASLKD